MLETICSTINGVKKDGCWRYRLRDYGKNRIRVYSELKLVDQIYVYDPDPKSISHLKSTCESVTVCPTIEDLIKKVDATSICVPTPDHFRAAKQLIESHIPCLIE